VLEALSLVQAKDMTFLNVALVEAFSLFIEVSLLVAISPILCTFHSSLQTIQAFSVLRAIDVQ